MRLTTRKTWLIASLSLVTVIGLLFLGLELRPTSTEAQSSVSASPVDKINTLIIDEGVMEYLDEQHRQFTEFVTAIIETEQKIASDAYVSSIYEAEAQRVAAEEAQAAQARRQTPASRTSPVGSTVGECSGFAIPDYIIQRESGGNPSAYNPSGAYGCAQTLLSHYSGGSCSGLDPYSIEGQRECVNILSNGGTNLNPWAQTR